MDYLFQRPLGPTFSILNFPKKFLVKAEIKQLAPKKIEKFWSKLKEYKQYLHLMGRICPTRTPPGILGLILFLFK